MRRTILSSPFSISLGFLSITITCAAAVSIAASCVDSAPTSSAPPPPTTDLDAATSPVTSVDASLDALGGPDPCTDVAPASAPAAYTWNNATILGGGFVSGIEFSHAQPAQNLVYARTDVGGAYRWDGTRWNPITDWVGRDNSNLMGIESIAPDPVDPNVVYVAAGEYLTTNGFMLRSTDQGKTWEPPHAIGIPMGGNADGRNVGERLAVDPNLTSTLYFGSRNSGLWTSADSATTWTRVASFPVTGPTSYGLSFVFFDGRGGSSGVPTSTIYVGVSPAATAQSGPSIYRSTDAGATWQTIPGDPSLVPVDAGAMGQFPLHGAMDAGGSLYFTYGNLSGPNSVTNGSVWRLDTSSGTWINVTPPRPRAGFGGVSVDPDIPGTVVVSTIDRYPDQIYRSTNGGASWIPILADATRDLAGANWQDFGTSAPGTLTTSWMGDIEIDPFQPKRVLYNTGGGIWSTDDATVAATHWTFTNQGLEETVALALISPSAGPPLLSGVGDIGGFRHDVLTQSPSIGMFADPVFGNTTALDFSEQHPALIVRVGTTSGPRHGSFSIDGGSSWAPFVSEPSVPVDGGTASAVSAGSIAVSADGATFVWAPQPASRRAPVVPVYSTDRSVTWVPTSGLPSGARVASDRVDPKKFYGTSGPQLYVSSDGGATFALAAAALPAGGGAARPTTGVSGDFWLGAGSGLFHSTDSGATLTQVAGVQAASAVGFGRAASCGNASSPAYPVLYIAGQANGVSGVYRSDDQGATWQRIDDPQHQFGFISYITGDPRLYGRAYLGSGGRGILYGDPTM
jgi:photosystem II stability/assembly factor-like uncharacterized protein